MDTDELNVWDVQLIVIWTLFSSVLIHLNLNVIWGIY